MATPRKNPEDFKPNGRPCMYTKELGDRICNLIATNACGLSRLTKEYGLPDKQTIFNWIQTIPEFLDQYLTARKFQSHVIADEIIDMAPNISTFEDKEGVERIDSGILGRAKFDFEAKKWHASKLEPKIYGDNKQVEDLKNANERVIEELAALKSRLDKENIKEY